MSKNQLGMPVLIELKDINEQILLCKKLGLSFIELHMNLPEYTLENLDPKLIRKLIKREKINFTLHLPSELDLGSVNKTIRLGYLKLCKQSILWAKKAGVRLINLHLNKGPCLTLPGKRIFLHDKYQTRFVTTIYNSFKALTDMANKNGVKIYLENANNFHLPFIKKALEKISKLKGLYFTWDIGHDALSGFREKPILMKYKNKVKHIHLHDYDGVLDHKALYTGKAEINKILAFAKKQKATVLIEVKTIKALKQSVELLKKKQKYNS
jgi:sugar phosphate isomerase/epimerase